MAGTTLARTLRSRRDARDLSLRELRAATAGERFPDGLATSYLQRLERGAVTEPSPHVLRALARALDLPYSRLMGEAGYYP